MLLAFVLAWLSAAAPTRAQETRIIDQKPFDELTLKTDNVVLKLAPLEIEPRRPLANEAADFVLRVRLQDKPKQQYEVRWADVAKVRLFEQLVLEEAAGLVKAKKFDEAYPYYVFLEKQYGKFPGVSEGYASFLFAEAEHWRSKGRLDQALALLNEVFARSPQHPQLDQALGQVVDGLVGGHLMNGRYAAARRLLKDLAARFPEHAVARQREAQLSDEATAALAKAKEAQAAQKWREAFEAVSLAVAKSPDLPGAKELLKEIQSQYTILHVGVLRLAAQDDLLPADGWSARRQRRLLHRQLTEAVSVTAEGTTYQSPLGAIDLKDGKTLHIKLQPKALYSNGAALSPHDGLRPLRWQAAPSAVAFSPPWANLVQTLDVNVASELVCQLRRPHAGPLAFLQVPLVPWNAVPWSAYPDGGGYDGLPSLGPYQVAARSSTDVRYVRQGNYLAASATLPSEIAERQLEADGAVPALLRGDVALLDRVPPWHVPALSGNNKIALVRYGASTLHFLVVNPKQARLSRPLVRRALLHGIHRQQILEDTLLGAADGNRGKLLSSLGVSTTTSEILPYDPRLMLATLQAAEPGPAVTPLQLVLAYPPSESARRVCREIQQQLSLDGRGPAVQLKELDGEGLRIGTSNPEGWDLLYVEWALIDPLVDVPAILQHAAGGGSAALHDALHRLSAAADRNAAQAVLAQIDQLVHDELTVLPLWQLTEFLAHDKQLQGIGAAPVTLYQNVEQWQRGASPTN